jgi:hypothetical protein
MPGGDRTGPAGAGPRTGRAMGYCTGQENPGFVTAGGGRGPGRGAGGGRRRRGRGGLGPAGGNARGGRGGRFRTWAVEEPATAPVAPPQLDVSDQPAPDGSAEPASESAELDRLGEQLQALQHQAQEIETRIEQLRRERPDDSKA